MGRSTRGAGSSCKTSPGWFFVNSGVVALACNPLQLQGEAASQCVDGNQCSRLASTAPNTWSSPAAVPQPCSLGNFGSSWFCGSLLAPPVPGTLQRGPPGALTHQLSGFNTRCSYLEATAEPVPQPRCAGNGTGSSYRPARTALPPAPSVPAPAGAANPRCCGGQDPPRGAAAQRRGAAAPVPPPREAAHGADPPASEAPSRRSLLRGRRVRCPLKPRARS